MRKVFAGVTVVLAGLAIAVSATAGNGTPINTGSANEVTLAVYGDAPYATNRTDTAQLEATPAFIDSVNADPKVDLVLHVGDIHSGQQLCTEKYDRAVFDLWTRYNDPLIYTPGDNEWSDCNKSGEGGAGKDADGNFLNFAAGDPIANLGLIRSIFFSNPGYSLGGRKKQVVTQAEAYDPAHPSDAKYVENVMWEQSKVLFVTINLPGGSNNDDDNWFGKPRTDAQTQEILERTGADLRWLDKAFAQAKADGVQGVLIGWQADVWDPEKGAAHQANYQPFVKSVADHTLDLGEPVLMINGDSHVYKSGNPLQSSDPNYNIQPGGYDVPNFHRIVVHGSTFPLEWLRLTVTPGGDGSGDTAFGPFSWEREIQP